VPSWATTSAGSRSAHRGAADAPRWQPSGAVGAPAAPGAAVAGRGEGTRLLSPRLQPSGAVGGAGGALVGEDKCGTEIVAPVLMGDDKCGIDIDAPRSCRRPPLAAKWRFRGSRLCPRGRRQVRHRDRHATVLVGNDKCGTEIAAPLCSWATASAAWTSAHRGAADAPRWQPSGGGAVGGACSALVGDDK
jgi:hypothetical protein